jgi:YVTN family beta-propeller protein
VPAAHIFSSMPLTTARSATGWILPLLIAACHAAGPESIGVAPEGAERERLPTGRLLDPAVPSMLLSGSFPLSAALSPDSGRVAVLLSGYSRQGIEIVDLRRRRVTQTLEQPAAFVGLAAAPDGRTLYASGGNQDVVYRYAWDSAGATLRDSLALGPQPLGEPGTRYPAGLGISPDGRFLYVAENLADSLAVLETATGRLVGRYPVGRYPYGVAVARDGTVYVSAWGGWTVSVFGPMPDGALEPRRQLQVARHPSALLLNRSGTRLFVASASTDRVAVIDTRTGQRLVELADPPPEGPDEGSTPNALALSPDGTLLYVAEADNNAVAVFALSPASADVPGAPGDDRLAGRIPVDWYPTVLAPVGDSLLVLSAKGHPPAANPDWGHPGRHGDERNYTLGQLTGTLAALAMARPGAALDQLTARVARANRWDQQAERPANRADGGYPPIEHVIYVIKENRTYDQVLGDMPAGDGDTTLVFFPRAVSPNHHALAERFGLFDRFFVNAEVSAQGHSWSTAAYSGDYVEKTVPSVYSDRGRTYDYEGTNRGDMDSTRGTIAVPDDDVAEPANGYLWNLAQQAGITFRNYGEFVISVPGADPDDAPVGYQGAKPFLATHTHPTFPGFNMEIPDQQRADIWIAELAEFVRRKDMPRLQIVRFPNDHTAGAKVGAPTPRAYMADNDLALGRMVEAVSRSPFWRSTAIFVLEDDAQDGPDHVDSHRSPLLVISPWARAGVHHRWANTTDVIATMAEILGLGSLSQFDFYGEPLRDIWRSAPDAAPYTALRPEVPLDERNVAGAPGSAESEDLDLAFEDRIPDDEFNRILWRAIKGEGVAYPEPEQLSAPEWAGVAARSR